MAWFSAMSGALMLRLALACAALPLAAGQWRDLGAGGCRAPGGLAKKLLVQRGLPDQAACREACGADPACTAVVFGERDGSTICHILGGGPYTRADAMDDDFTCSAKEMKCSMPFARWGYDFDATTCGPAAESPECEVRCAAGFAGAPSASCLSDGGVFALGGCALVTGAWRFQSQGNCVATGARPPVGTLQVASLAECQAACEAREECGGVTHHEEIARCHLFAGGLPEPATVTDTPSGKQQCWALKAAADLNEPPAAALRGR